MATNPPNSFAAICLRRVLSAQAISTRINPSSIGASKIPLCLADSASPAASPVSNRRHRWLSCITVKTIDCGQKEARDTHIGCDQITVGQRVGLEDHQEQGQQTSGLAEELAPHQKYRHGEAHGKDTCCQA